MLNLPHTGPGNSANLSSARGNLVGTFVNAFVNAGFDNDELTVTAGIWTEGDFALSLLGEHTENRSVPLKTSTFMGLVLTYTGSHREDLLTCLLPHVADDTITMEISGLAALALGFICWK